MTDTVQQLILLSSLSYTKVEIIENYNNYLNLKTSTKELHSECQQRRSRVGSGWQNPLTLLNSILLLHIPKWGISKSLYLTKIFISKLNFPNQLPKGKS